VFGGLSQQSGHVYLGPIGLCDDEHSCTVVRSLNKKQQAVATFSPGALMSNDIPKPEKVLRIADEIAPQELNSADASANSYYQLLLKKCRSRRALLPASDPNVGR
jgi:hypothetical protein